VGAGGTRGGKQKTPNFFLPMPFPTSGFLSLALGRTKAFPTIGHVYYIADDGFKKNNIPPPRGRKIKEEL